MQRRRESCTNQQPPQRGGAVPYPVWFGSKWLLAFPRVPVTPGTPLTQTVFLPCCPLNGWRRAVRSFFKMVACLFLSCLFLARLRLFILLLLLMNGSIHPKPGRVLLCSACAGNVTWRGRSVKCCTCFK